MLKIRVREIPPSLSRVTMAVPQAPRPLAVIGGFARTLATVDANDPTLVKMPFGEEIHLENLRAAGIIFDVVEY